MEKKRILSLDSTRGIAALIVVIYHFIRDLPEGYDYVYSKPDSLVGFLFKYTPLHLFWDGENAVIYFFILSGFVLSIPYLTRDHCSFKENFHKRFIRLYIPYIFAMLVSITLLIILFNVKSQINLSPAFGNRWATIPTITELISYGLFIDYNATNVNGAVWSLVHEFRISIFIPFITIYLVKAKPKKSLTRAVPILMISYLVIRMIPSFGSEYVAYLRLSFLNTVYFSIFFLSGILLAYSAESIKNKLKQSNKLSILMIVTGVLLIESKWMLLALNVNLPNKFNQIVSGFGFVILLTCVLVSPGIQKTLEHPVLLYFGKISYSLYLTHMVTMAALDRKSVV